ncbi:MAG: ring-cleaving dioxygenase [Gemmatimonadetes bacterium]|nr:ring-cleaving dioxygenase [Gemmatimonadota bacterium]
MELKGIHHVTAVSADIAANHRFYTRTLGMRLVKRSVNQDDVSAYHLFYADAVGTPGTDLTFFDWPVPPARRGTHSIVRTQLRVGSERALEWWAAQLRGEAGLVAEITERAGRATLDFEDAEGQRLSLVNDAGAGAGGAPWEGSPVAPEYQVRGLGPVLLSVPNLRSTDRLFQEVMGLRPVAEYAAPETGREAVRVYEMAQGGPGAEVHVAEQPDLPPARQGAGSVHHVAFRTPDEQEYAAWLEHLSGHGVRHSGPVDRFWFRSIYFREPNGILFEIATDGPGFAVDEDPATLGQKVVLPPFLEPQREQILRHLKPID